MLKLIKTIAIFRLTCSFLTHQLPAQQISKLPHSKNTKRSVNLNLLCCQIKQTISDVVAQYVMPHCTRFDIRWLHSRDKTGHVGAKTIEKCS